MNNFISRANLGFSQKRQPTFAGTWYDADAKKLRAQLETYLSNAETTLAEKPVETGFLNNEKPTEPILAIVAPHAGYMFSGQTAAFAYQEARVQKPKRVFLLGPSHYIGFEGAALPTESVFATPLGDLQIDKDVVQELADFPLFTQSSEIHRREHSLEMQLPFIREAFGDVKIVPIVVGTLNEDMEVRLVAQILRRYLRPDDLVVVSSDFTHFGPRYEYEPFHSDVKENIRKLDSEAFEYLSRRDLPGFIKFKQRTNDTICGFYPCAILLALLPDNSSGSLLRYRTSQDTLVEDDRNSVSYLALAFSNPDQKDWQDLSEKSSSGLTESDKENMLKLARLTLERHVENRPVDDTSAEMKQLASDATKKNMGVFVTLYKLDGSKVRDRAHKDLRGCIGYIWPVKTLFQAVIDNTIGASSRDYRFVPVTRDELADLQIDINVLTPPQRVASHKDIVVGRDGVVMYKEGKQAVFLPSVATEFGWDLNELLTQLSLKAGLGPDGWKQGARFDVFQSESFEEDA